MHPRLFIHKQCRDIHLFSVRKAIAFYPFYSDDRCFIFRCSFLAKMTESEFLWQHNQDPMTVQKLTEGIPHSSGSVAEIASESSFQGCFTYIVSLSEKLSKWLIISCALILPPPCFSIL
ncbi:hypothetical protein FY046_23510 [Erwinia sp. 1181_3]